MLTMLAVIGLAVEAVTPAAGGPAPGVKVLVSFEWEEFAPKVGRSMVIGKPIQGPPKRGFRAERLKSLEKVGPEGFQIFYPKSSRDHAGPIMVRRYATEGEFAWKCKWTEREWRWRLGQLKRKWPGPWPPHEPLYDVYDHFFQRECQLYRKEWRFADWRGYARLRFDVRAEGAPLTLGVRLRDGSGPLVRGKPTGLRTIAARFTIPADQTVTCDEDGNWQVGPVYTRHLLFGRADKYTIVAEELDDQGHVKSRASIQLTR